MRKIFSFILLIGMMLSVGVKINANTVSNPTANNINLFSTYYAIAMNWEIPEGTIYIEVTIPIYSGLVMTQTGSGLKSYIDFKDESNTSIEDYDFEEIGGRMYGVFRFILSEFNAPDTRNFSMVFMHNYGSSLPSGLIADMTANIIVKANDTLRYVKYYSQGVLYITNLFVDIPITPSPPTPPTGYEFNGWTYGSGEPYNFTAVTNNDLINDTFYLYADFIPTTNAVVVPEPTTSVPQDVRNILALVRLDNTSGYGVAYALLAIIIIVVSILWLKADALIIAFIELVWLGLALYIGLLSLWVTIVIGLFIVLVIMYKLKNGALL